MRSPDPSPTAQLNDTDQLSVPVSSEPAGDACLEPALQMLGKLLVTRPELSQLISLDVRTLARMDAAGELPGRIKIGKSVRYDVAAIKQWIACGCDMTRWKAMHRGRK